MIRRAVTNIPKLESQSPCYNFSHNISSLPTKFEFPKANDTAQPPPPTNTVWDWDELYDLNYEELSTRLKNTYLDGMDSQGYSLLNRCVLLQMIRSNSVPIYDRKYYEMLVFLIEKGCDVNLKSSRNQNTPLHLVLNPKVGLIKHTNRELNEVRIKCEIQKKTIETSMDPIEKMDILFDRKIEIIKLLLRNGALNLTDCYGFDPVMIANNLAERNKNIDPVSYKYYCEICHLLNSHFSLTVGNIIHSHILCTPRLLSASVKHGVPNVMHTYNLVTRLVHKDVNFAYTFVCELSHRFLGHDDIYLAFNENLKIVFYVLQYFDLEYFLYYFSFEAHLKALSKSPLKSCLKFSISLPNIGIFHLYSFSIVFVYLDAKNKLNWILPYMIVDHLTRVEGIFSLFHSLLSNNEFDVSQIGPFFIDLISHIDPESELASDVQYLLVRYFLLLELWILHRPADESKILHLKEDLIKSSVFTYDTLAHYLLNNFLLFESIRIKTSFPLQFNHVSSLWKNIDKFNYEDVSLKSDMHIFLKILESISFQVNNLDSLNNSCLHILARMERADFMFFLLDCLGAYPFVLNSNCLTFLDIYIGINDSISLNNLDVPKNIEKLRKYFSKPYTLRTLSGYVLSKLSAKVLNFMNLPANILKFVLLHQKPNSGSEIFDFQPKCKNTTKTHRKHRTRHTADKHASTSMNRVHFDAFSYPEETQFPKDFCIQFNPGII